MIANLLYIIAALLIIEVIVAVHEFGHYLAGRLCGMGIVEYSIGMGPKIIGFRKNDIDYSLRAIPIGGFCKFVGEDEDNSDPRAMNNQAVWKRIITVAAGALMNFVLAYVAAVILFAAFSYKTIPAVGNVLPDTPAMEAGLLAGDQIVAVNGMDVADGLEGVTFVQSVVGKAQGETVSFDVQREGQRLQVDIAPALVTLEDGSQVYQVGIQFGVERYGFWESFPAAGEYMLDSSTMMLDALRKLVFKGEGADDMVGTVGIISMVSETVREGWHMVFLFLFVISLNLGIINLLPLPALDGGRLVFLIVEAIRGKPIPPEKEGIVHAIGFVLLLVLFVVLTYQDIVRIIAG